MDKISVTLTTNYKEKPAGPDIPFGVFTTDHMFLMNYDREQGWHDPRIVPYAPFQMDPACMVLHYAQEIFEGMKAYRDEEGKIRLFRPEENFKRMNDSCERMSIPKIDVDFCVEAVKQLVTLEKDWVPTAPNTSLYIRPFIFATDIHVGVHASHTYQFAVILSPVGPYYATGLAPVSIMIEEDDVRAVRGGTGFTKCGGNYAASLRAGEKAEEKGFSQVLWLDGVERKYIEEVGSMNVLFKIGGKIVTPALNGSILPGITRKSCLQLLRDKGYEVEERRLSVDELIGAARDGSLEEAFGSGTAAVVSPIGSLYYKGETFVISGGGIGPVAQDLYDTLTGIQWGRVADPYGWSQVIC
ncbi:MAG: branched-chain amino acid aminotransferase [Oscillospiraceae bacterium]|nr:branched-chain amino acid aminotransferase [Oscillospiraceae bacterium]